MKYNGIVLFSDLDGTLLDEQRRLSDENLQAIHYFVREGGRFGVATGRMERTTLINFPELPLNTPSIFFNGALVYDTIKDERVFSVFMPQGLEPVFQDILDRYPTTGVEINVPGKAYILRNNDIIRIQLAREGLMGIEAGWSEVSREWYKVLLLDDHETLKKIKADLEALKRTDIEIMFSETELLDIMAQKVSKGTALKHQMIANKDQWRKVFAVGDNDNDYEMVKAADVGIAVANARNGVKELAKHEIAHHSIPCIPQILSIIDQYL